jgi:hypothetical protein
VSKTYRDRPRGKGRFAGRSDDFRCRHCRIFVGAPPSGGRHRNHCPACLYSRHVDLRTPGDRASDCGALMAPVAMFARPGGEEVIVHRCRGCGFERHCRVAADDDVAGVMRLPLVAARLDAGRAGQRAARPAGRTA